MIYLIYGPDTFRSRYLLSDIIEEFKKKDETGVPAFFRFDAEEDNIERLLQLRRSQSLFGSKELVVIERALSSPRNIFSAFEPLLAEWAKSQTAIFVFWDGDLYESDILSGLKKHSAKVQEFKLLSGLKLARWVDEEISRRGLELSSADKRALIVGSDGDLWKLNHELDKYELGGQVYADKAPEEEKIWNFTDAFMVSKKSALAVSYRLTSGGTDTLYLVGALAKTLRIISALRDAMVRKIQSSEVGRKMKVHPFVLKKGVESARLLAEETLSKNHRLLLAVDENTKTGKLPASLAFLKLFVK